MLPLLFFIISLISPTFVQAASYELSVCAIFQDEAPYLKEWIEFHKIQGVEHFYLYNNNSTDNYLEVLTPYTLSDEVTLVNWPYTYSYGDHKKWIKIQCGAYKDCIKKHKDDTKWLAVIDIDEFLFCPEGKRLPEFLSSYNRYGGVAVNWIKFGTSNIVDIPEDVCMIELLTRCTNQYDPQNLSTKSIVQPKRVANCSNPHYFKYKKSYRAVLANKEPLSGFESPINDVSQIRINHYWTRTISYFLNHKIDSRQKRRPYYTNEVIQGMTASYNECSDATILRYVDDLRRAMDYNMSDTQ